MYELCEVIRRVGIGKAVISNGEHALCTPRAGRLTAPSAKCHRG